jgi:threonine/homoserine/homoserine lactone efflux protein
MSIIVIAVTSFVVALSGALVPGPLFTITVGESVKRGFSAGPMIILGHGLLEAVVVALIVFGVMPAVTAEKTRMVIGFGGGIILILMGAMILKDCRSASLNIDAGGGRTGLNPVVSGVVGSLSNPYWVIWWMTIGLGYLVSALKYGAAGVIAFFAGHIAADLGWYSLLAFAVSKGRAVMGDRGYRITLFTCGLFLIFFGFWFILGRAK